MVSLGQYGSLSVKRMHHLFCFKFAFYCILGCLKLVFRSDLYPQNQSLAFLDQLSMSLSDLCQLNAFFDYPLLKLNLHQHFNPILLYNLTSYSYGHKNNKTLLRF